MTYDNWKTSTPPAYEQTQAEACDLCGTISEQTEMLCLCVKCATTPKATGRLGIEAMREAVRMFGDCNESFNERFTIEQLMMIFDMQRKSGWTFYPDQWTERQVREALQGKTPRWSDDEKPVYE